MYSKAMFAKQFKELIDKRGLTQRAVAERINTTETTISRYVSGDRTPNIETAVELASVLGVTLAFGRWRSAAQPSRPPATVAS